jgi:hypothetical protein
LLSTEHLAKEAVLEQSVEMELSVKAKLIRELAPNMGAFINGQLEIRK